MYIEPNLEEQTSKWLDNLFTRPRGMFVTIHYSGGLSDNRDFNTRMLLERVNKQFLRKLERKLGFNDRTRLEKLVVIEKGKFRNHVHMVVETPIHISNEKMTEMIQRCIRSNTKLGSSDIQPFYDKEGLVRYLSKEVSIQEIDCIDLKNTFTKKKCIFWNRTG